MKRLRVLTVLGALDNAVSYAKSENNQEMADDIKKLRNIICDLMCWDECVYWDELLQRSLKADIGKEALSFLERIGEKIKEPI